MTPHSLRTHSCCRAYAVLALGGDTHGALQWVGVGILRGTLGGGEGGRSKAAQAGGMAGPPQSCSHRFPLAGHLRQRLLSPRRRTAS